MLMVAIFKKWKMSSNVFGREKFRTKKVFWMNYLLNCLWNMSRHNSDYSKQLSQENTVLKLFNRTKCHITVKM